ncbi:hypothetical protein ACFE04_013574 [Oxalis oulophora]
MHILRWLKDLYTLLGKYSPYKKHFVRIFTSLPKTFKFIRPIWRAMDKVTVVEEYNTIVNVAVLRHLSLTEEDNAHRNSTMIRTSYLSDDLYEAKEQLSKLMNELDNVKEVCCKVDKVEENLVLTEDALHISQAENDSLKEVNNTLQERFELDEDELGKRIKVDAYNNFYYYSDHHQMGKTSLNSVTPCAACKLLRRRCAQECPFSPYFSPHEPHKFAAVHKVFGASNVSKLLSEVAESQRADAANSLVYEANLRIRDPVYGSMGAISALQQQLQTLQAELNLVRTEILKYKYTTTTNNNNNDIIISSAPQALVSSVGTPISITAAPPSQSLPPSPPPPPPPPPSIVVSSSSNNLSSTCSLLFTVPSSRITDIGFKVTEPPLLSQLTTPLYLRLTHPHTLIHSHFASTRLPTTTVAASSTAAPPYARLPSSLLLSITHTPPPLAPNHNSRACKTQKLHNSSTPPPLASHSSTTARQPQQHNPSSATSTPPFADHSADHNRHHQIN